MGRDPRYGQLTCGGCSEKQRDEFRCVLKGHERAPAIAAAYRVDMGPNKKPGLFTACPVGTSLTDRAATWLTAYGVINRWSKWPPGRDDPQLLEAVTIIQREHDLIDLESTQT